MNEVVKKECNCGPECTCGCNEGKPCTCEGKCHNDTDSKCAGNKTCCCHKE